MYWMRVKLKCMQDEDVIKHFSDYCCLVCMYRCIQVNSSTFEFYTIIHDFFNFFQRLTACGLIRSTFEFIFTNMNEFPK